MVLMERDYQIMRVINRFRFCLGRHVKELCDFSGTRTADRRLKILCDNGYLEKRKILYGVPAVYTLTHKAKVMLGVSKRKSNINLGRLLHDIAVLDTASYLVQNQHISLSDVKTEREMFSEDGFGKVKHRPDFIVAGNNMIIAYEIELSLKAKERFHKNVKDNYLNCDKQIWIVPEHETEILKLLTNWQSSYNNIDVLLYEVVKGEK